MANLIDRDTVRKFLTAYHSAAAVALRGANPPGVLQTCRQMPDSVMHSCAYAVGDVDHMLADAIIDAEAGHNVYAECRAVRSGRPNERGRIEATVGLFVFVVDHDNDTGKAGDPDHDGASVVVETSPGNFQSWYFLREAVGPEKATAIGAAIRKAAGADSCTGTVTQPFRIPGLPNHPTKKKIARGRDPNPVATRIVSMSDKRWSPDDLLGHFSATVALPPAPKPKPKQTKPVSKAKARAVEVRVAKPADHDMDRSAQFQAAVNSAKRNGMTADQTEELMRQHPEGCASKYLAGPDRLRAEIDRSFDKAEQAATEKEQTKEQQQQVEQQKQREAHAERAAAGKGIDGAALLDEMYTFLGEFISYPSKGARAAHVLWIAHTYLMDCWDSTPRLTFLSPEPGSGKSRCLELTETLVPTPLLAANITPSALFRKAGEEQVTLLIDEADTTFKVVSETSEKLRKFLNVSHRRGYTNTMCAKTGSSIELEETPCFVPVALAALQLSHMPETVMSRSIVIPMRRRAPTEVVKPFRRRKHGPTGNALRDRLHLWAAAAQDDITARLDSDDEHEIEMPKLIADRDADVWEPLFLIADAAGGHWPETARCNAVTFVMASTVSGTSASWGLNLLSDMRAVIDGADAKFTSAVLDELHKKDESPWNDIKGKPLTDRGLAERLKPYGIKSKLIRIGSTVARGYSKSDFLDAWARYLPPTP